MENNQPRWRTNSSFSPPPSRRWEFVLQSDGLPPSIFDGPICGSSLSSDSKGSRNRMNNDQYLHHQHSMSEGTLSSCGSPPDNFQSSQWTPPMQKHNCSDFPSSMGGFRPEPHTIQHIAEDHFPGGGSAVSNSNDSPSVSECRQWGSTSKQPISFSHRNISGRRSFISKPVYPLVFRNPVSDEVYGPSNAAPSGTLTPYENRASTFWQSENLNSEIQFYSELRKMQASPDPSSSSRREGFRWSNASSYDFGFDGDGSNVLDNVDWVNPKSPHNFSKDQRCGLCGRFMWQKSPWSSYRIIKNGDMPTAGVLSCSHVFHADCLEETIPNSQIHDPPCPLCLKSTNETELSPSTSEPLQMSLRSLRRNKGINFDAGSSLVSDQCGSGGFRRNQSLPIPRRERGISLIKKHLKKHLKKHFTFSGKNGNAYSVQEFPGKLIHPLHMRTERKQTGVLRMSEPLKQ